MAKKNSTVSASHNTKSTDAPNESSNSVATNHLDVRHNNISMMKEEKFDEAKLLFSRQSMKYFLGQMNGLIGIEKIGYAFTTILSILE